MPIRLVLDQPEPEQPTPFSAPEHRAFAQDADEVKRDEKGRFASSSNALTASVKAHKSGSPEDHMTAHTAHMKAAAEHSNAAGSTSDKQRGKAHDFASENHIGAAWNHKNAATRSGNEKAVASRQALAFAKSAKTTSDKLAKS
jgi:hypothetical protein